MGAQPVLVQVRCIDHWEQPFPLVQALCTFPRPLRDIRTVANVISHSNDLSSMSALRVMHNTAGSRKVPNESTYWELVTDVKTGFGSQQLLHPQSWETYFIDDESCEQKGRLGVWKVCSPTSSRRGCELSCIYRLVHAGSVASLQSSYLVQHCGLCRQCLYVAYFPGYATCAHADGPNVTGYSDGLRSAHWDMTPSIEASDGGHRPLCCFPVSSCGAARRCKRYVTGSPLLFYERAARGHPVIKWRCEREADS